MKKNTEITVLSETVRVQRIAQEDFISLTDIAKFRNPDAIEQMEILTGE
jgi:hypothetical protein